jgi:ABC-type antimicrobial peptide transport system permease subunit
MDEIEKQKVMINYKGSGVKTLSRFGVFFFIIGIIAAIIAAIGFLRYLTNADTSTGLSLASSFFPTAIGLLASAAVCTGLSSIAKTALYKRILLE